MKNLIIIVFGVIILMLSGKIIYDWAYFGDDARCYSNDCVDYAD